MYDNKYHTPKKSVHQKYFNRPLHSTSCDVTGVTFTFVKAYYSSQVVIVLGQGCAGAIGYGYLMASVPGVRQWDVNRAVNDTYIGDTWNNRSSIVCKYIATYLAMRATLNEIYGRS